MVFFHGAHANDQMWQMIRHSQRRNAAYNRARLELQKQSADERIAQLEDHIGALEMYVIALQRLLLLKGVCTPEELAAIVNEVDAEDGKMDGKFKPDTVEPLE
jgi:hypothetical protein